MQGKTRGQICIKKDFNNYLDCREPSVTNAGKDAEVKYALKRTLTIT